MQNKQASDL